MDRDKLTAAIRPLALAFAGELADILHKHMSARVDVVRKGAVEQLRADLEGKLDVDVSKKRPRPGRGSRKAHPRRRPAGEQRHPGRRDPGVDSRVRPAAPRGAVPSSSAKGTVTCSVCGEAGHNKRGCSKADRSVVDRARPQEHPRERDRGGAGGPRAVVATSTITTSVIARRGSKNNAQGDGYEQDARGPGSEAGTRTARSSAAGRAPASAAAETSRRVEGRAATPARPRPVVTIASPPPAKLDRFARIEERARARVGVDGLPIPSSSFEL